MSTQPSYQTVRLSRGKHSSPSQGVCVMELTSMLAGEPFTDRPACADPVIGGLLRAYNDTVDGERRQDLYQVASLVVGTASTPEVERMRANRCLAFAAAHRRRSRWRRRHGTPALAAHLGQDAPGVLAVRALGRVDDARHGEILALIEELVWIGTPWAERPPRGAGIAGAATAAGAGDPLPLSSAPA
jgi:hypothetical protein